MIDEVAPELVDAYAAFRGERTSDDELTADELRFPSLGEPAFGLNVGLSRRVRATNGLDAVLVPGDGVVGMVERGGGGVAGLHQLLDGSPVGTSFQGTGRLVVSGVMPDGVEEVRIAARNGQESRWEVHDHLSSRCADLQRLARSDRRVGGTSSTQSPASRPAVDS